MQKATSFRENETMTIARQHNDLIELPLRKFNASEIDLLNAICYSCQNQGTKEVVLPFSRLRELALYKSKDEQRFISALESTNRKLLNLNFTLRNANKIVQFALFPTFEIDLDAETLTVQVHDIFSYLLNNTNMNYTTLELEESAQLISSYAKGLYKRLREFRMTGKWRVSIEEFREYLDIPASYRAGHIWIKVIQPSIEELQTIFQGLACEPYYEKHTGKRGRPAIRGYEFTFKAQQTGKKPEDLSQEQIADMTGWKFCNRYCPKCHEKMYQKRMTDKRGETYMMYGHADFKTGQCNAVYYDFADLLDKHQLDEVEGKNRPQTEEQKANRNKFESMLKGLFKAKKE